MEVGFLKLFIGTESKDLSDIEPSLPFMAVRLIGGAIFSKSPMRWDTTGVRIALRKAKEATWHKGLEISQRRRTQRTMVIIALFILIRNHVFKNSASWLCLARGL